MAWRSKPKHNERTLLKKSEALFHPALQMKWRWKGTSFDLLREGEVIWSSVTGAQSWDYPGAARMGKVLQAYMSTPVATLRKKDVEHIILKGFYYHKPVKENFDLLVKMLLAADRRLGKNWQSLWLFVEPDLRVRNIIGRRC